MLAVWANCTPTAPACQAREGCPMGNPPRHSGGPACLTTNQAFPFVVSADGYIRPQRSGVASHGTPADLRASLRTSDTRSAGLSSAGRMRDGQPPRHSGGPACLTTNQAFPFVVSADGYIRPQRSGVASHGTPADLRASLQTSDTRSAGLSSAGRMRDGQPPRHSGGPGGCRHPGLTTNAQPPRSEQPQTAGG